MRLAFVVLLLAVLGCGTQTPPKAIKEPPEEKGPPVVLVTSFNVPEEVHDQFKNELALWPDKIIKDATEKDGPQFLAESESPRYVLGGELKATKKEVQIIAWLQDERTREIVWSDTYTLTEFPKKVEFVDESRSKIVAGVKEFLKK